MPSEIVLVLAELEREKSCPFTPPRTCSLFQVELAHCLVTPMQKQRRQPSGLASDKWKNPALHSSHKAPATLFLQLHGWLLELTVPLLSHLEFWLGTHFPLGRRGLPW